MKWRNETSPMFDGQLIGAEDSNGIALRCGDQVTVKWHTYPMNNVDGWGRDLPGTPPPSKRADEEAQGRIAYIPSRGEFVVQIPWAGGVRYFSLYEPDEMHKGPQ